MLDTISMSRQFIHIVLQHLVSYCYTFLCFEICIYSIIYDFSLIPTPLCSFKDDSLSLVLLLISIIPFSYHCYPNFHNMFIYALSIYMSNSMCHNYLLKSPTMSFLFGRTTNCRHLIVICLLVF